MSEHAEVFKNVLDHPVEQVQPRFTDYQDS
jgi:hypothetical protein